MSTLAPVEARVAPADGVAPRTGAEVRAFLRRAGLFLGIGVIFYLALYGVAESLVQRNTVRNRFFAIQSASIPKYDFVILGASHAAVLDYREMNARLEERLGARVLNLSTVGAGISVNRLLLDYFFEKSASDAVVYILDSFAFYSPQWNEERLKDVELYRRAGWDPGLARLLFREPATRSVALSYLLGFFKINDPNRFEPDLFEAEGSRFERVYRPIPQLDRQRLEYLYPAGLASAPLAENAYLRALEEMIREVRERDLRMIVIRPPLPERVRAAIPQEAEFDRVLQPLVMANGAEYFDFSMVNNDPEFFYDSDHLNLVGVERFIEDHLSRALLRSGSAAAGTN